MRITIVQGAFLPVPALRGGALEKAWDALGREFARRGHQVTHISRQCDGLPERQIIDGVQHLRILGYDMPKSQLWMKFYDFFFSRAALRLLPAADILVTNSFWLPILVQDVSRGRLYVHVARFPKGQMGWYHRAARLQTISLAVAEAIQKQAPNCAQLVKILPLPLTDGVWEPEPLPDEKRDSIVLYTGRIHPEKGLELLAAAWTNPRTRAALAGWKLVLAGGWSVAHGGGGEQYRRHLANLFAPAGDSVVWAGPLFGPDTAKLNELYRRARIFAYPSIAEKGEALSLSTIEAMGAGTPSVVSNLDCFREFMRDGENGLVFDHRAADAADNLSHALVTLAGDPARRAALGVAAWETAKRYRLEEVASCYLEDFESLRPRASTGDFSPKLAPRFTYRQSSPYISPWSLSKRIRILLWEFSWPLFCRWTPKPFNGWRLMWLRMFGAKIQGSPFVHQRARVTHPWNLTLRDRACLGDDAHAYALGPIDLGEGCTIAQEAYLCTGTHDFSAPELPLQISPIVIGARAFVGMRAIILLGVTLGEGSVVGAGAVVARNVPPGETVAGNPARPIRRKEVSKDA